MYKKGFTLVEVLIVVIIIGILAAIGIPQFAAAIERAKGGEARAGLGHIQTAEKIYFAENDAYYGFVESSEDSYDLSEPLDVILTQRYWTFIVEEPHPDTGVGYLATATRKGTGPTALQTIRMDNAGKIDGDWTYLSE